MSAGTPELRQVGAGHPDVRHALDVKQGRDPGRLLIAGIWAHHAALDAGVGFDSFFCADELVHSREGRALAELVARRSRSRYRVSAKIASRMSERDRVDGLASVIELPRWRQDRIRLGSAPLIVVADGLQSPGNVGSVLRTMDASRADLLIITRQQTRSTTAKVFQGSRGRSLTVPQIGFDTVAEAIDWLRDRSIRILVADADASSPYTAVDFRGPTAIVLGNERHGPAEEWRGCKRVGIPMLGRADSLNVAVSSGVLLYQARAQREGW